MPVHLVAFVYVTVFSLIAFALLKRPMTAQIISLEDFVRRRNAWLIVSAMAFLANNFWVYAFATGVVAWLLSQRDRNVMAAFFALVFAVPLLKFPISGFGVVNHLLVMDHQRILAIVLLAPVAYRLMSESEPMNRLTWWVGFFVFAHFMQGVITAGAYDSFTQGMRTFVTDGLSIWLCFYVAAKSITSVRSLREVLMTYVMAFAVLGLIGMFESARGWLIYESLREPLGAHIEGSTSYFVRDTGFGSLTRSMTTSGHAIIFGYASMVALVFWSALRHNMGTRNQSWVVFALVLGGMLSSLSRGPWVGAVVGLAAVMLSGRGFAKRLVLLVIGATIGILGLLATPLASKVLAFVPFFGDVGAESADYRVQLFHVSMLVFWDSPWIGHFEAIKDPRMEVMRQGQGIIDMVNAYLGIGLSYGFVGLFSFLAPHVLVLWALFKSMREVESVNPTVALTGRAIFGATVASLTSLATTSSFDFIPIIYWTLLGLSVSYVACTVKVIQQHRLAQMQAHLVGRSMATSKPTGMQPLTAPR
jgi:O-antigen ligase